MLYVCGCRCLQYVMRLIMCVCMRIYYICLWVATVCIYARAWKWACTFVIKSEHLNTQALYILDIPKYPGFIYIYRCNSLQNCTCLFFQMHLIKRLLGGLPKNASLEELQNFFYEQGPAVGSTFQPVNGGFDRACRGANIGDNRASYYRVVSLQSLANCEQKCLDSHGCVAVEYSKGRCELWLKKVEATLSLGGS